MTHKIAVIGNGRTGGEVVKLLHQGELVGPFNTNNAPSIHLLAEADAAIVFVPGDAMSQLCQMLVSWGKPVISGCTGFKWPEELDTALQQKKLTWITASNFSLVMVLIKNCLQIFGQASSLYSNVKYHIDETHHVHKKDQPSGTALSWQKWLGHHAPIISHREGEIIGQHRLTLTTASETIQLQHDAHHRRLYAEGAIWATRQILEGHYQRSGLISFDDMVASCIFSQKGGAHDRDSSKTE